MAAKSTPLYPHPGACRRILTACTWKTLAIPSTSANPEMIFIQSETLVIAPSETGWGM